MKRLVILLISSIVFIANATAGPWPQKKGNGYYKLSEWWTIFDQHFTDTGLKDPNVTTGIFNTAFYGEYGITDRWTGLVNANIFSRTYMNNLRSATTGEIIVPGEALNSIGDIDLGIKYGLNKSGSKTPLSATLVLGIPTGNASGGTFGNLQTGDGEFNQYIQLDAGKGFNIGKKINSYVSAYAGFNNRTNDFSEEIRFGGEWGLGLLKRKLWLVGKLNVVESLKNGLSAAEATGTSIFANNTEYTSLAVEVNFYLNNRIGISANAATALRGEIIAAANSYSVGVFYDLKK